VFSVLKREEVKLDERKETKKHWATDSNTDRYNGTNDRRKKGANKKNEYERAIKKEG
jgi:hypothetical protein